MRGRSSGQLCNASALTKCQFHNYCCSDWLPMAFTIHVNILVLALKRMINMKMIKARSLDSGDGDFDDTCILHPVWNILHATSAWKLGVLRVWAEKNILKLHKKKQFLKKKIFEIFCLQKKRTSFRASSRPAHWRRPWAPPRSPDFPLTWPPMHRQPVLSFAGKLK